MYFDNEWMTLTQAYTLGKFVKNLSFLSRAYAVYQISIFRHKYGNKYAKAFRLGYNN